MLRRLSLSPQIDRIDLTGDSMAGKKDAKAAKPKNPTEELEGLGKISSAADLKSFLQGVLDKMKEENGAAAIYVVSAMNYVLNIPQVYDYLNNENRELARDIWLRLKQSGFQVKNPPILFGETDGAAER